MDAGVARHAAGYIFIVPRSISELPMSVPNVPYNLERSHQGYRLRGRTPAQALLEALGRNELPPLIASDGMEEKNAA